MKVRLILEPKGYRPEHSDWEGFRPSTNGALIVHDLYHHYPNERGTIEEELVSIGARLRFDSVCFRDKGLKGFSVADAFYYSELEKSECHVLPKGKNSLPKLLDLVLNNLWAALEIKKGMLSISPDVLAKKLAKNYDRVRQFPLNSYREVRDYPYVKTYNTNSDLIVNLKTGKIVPVDHEWN